MFRELMEQVDIKKLEDVLGSLQIEKPSIVTSEDSNFEKFFNKSRLCIIQVNYYDGQEDYSIGKVYVSINPLTEIALDSMYQFHALNFYRESDENIIHSYKQNGEKLAEYYIDRDVLETPSDSSYMTKSNGDRYHPAYRVSDDEWIEKIRIAWEATGSLLCYSIKQDGRRSFYIIIDQGLDGSVAPSNFIGQVGVEA